MSLKFPKSYFKGSQIGSFAHFWGFFSQTDLLFYLKKCLSFDFISFPRQTFIRRYFGEFEFLAFTEPQFQMSHEEFLPCAQSHSSCCTSLCALEIWDFLHDCLPRPYPDFSRAVPPCSVPESSFTSQFAVWSNYESQVLVSAPNWVLITRLLAQFVPRMYPRLSFHWNLYLPIL